ncbi:MAG: eukaryotic initiation factor [Monoraphidium minutum]|nr:MAG: eukaryotic initiation factor [Monoraphidium minutum]
MSGAAAAADASGGAADDPWASRKHPLESRWTLWFEQKQQKAGLRPLHTFDSVEDFWCLHANIKAPSGLAPASTVALFKEGIEPRWEDPANAGGGCWTAVLPRATNAAELLDSWWLALLLACIGEQFEAEGDEVCGATVSIRHGKNRVELWTRSAGSEALQVSIGKQLRAVLKTVPETTRMGFATFADKMQPGKARDRYYA